MSGLRRLLPRYRLLFAWLIAAAFAMKLVIPAGFMPVMSAHSITIELCDGYGAPMLMTSDMTDGHDGHHKPDKAQAPCSFTMLSAPTLAATDLILLAAAILFVMVQGTRRVSLPIMMAGRLLRPPLRGPPTFT
jgi:hypothetical protein